MKTQG